MKLREIDNLRKLSPHDLAVLIDNIVNYDPDGHHCPVCIGCVKARELDFDCIKARETFLKRRIANPENSLLTFNED